MAMPHLHSVPALRFGLFNMLIKLLTAPRVEVRADTSLSSRQQARSTLGGQVW